MFYLNKHPAGKIWNFLFSLAQLVGGLVGVFTLGHVSSSLPTIAAKKAVDVHLTRLKKNRANS